MSYCYLNRLFNGELGRVIEIEDGSDWDEETCDYIVEGIRYELGMEVCGIDEWIEENGVDGLVLLRSDGYRGKLCYSGLMEVDGKYYNLDIINDYMVYEVEKR